MKEFADRVTTFPICAIVDTNPDILTAQLMVPRQHRFGVIQAELPEASPVCGDRDATKETSPSQQERRDEDLNSESKSSDQDRNSNNKTTSPDRELRRESGHANKANGAPSRSSSPFQEISRTVNADDGDCTSGDEGADFTFCNSGNSTENYHPDPEFIFEDDKHRDFADLRTEMPMVCSVVIVDVDGVVIIRKSVHEPLWDYMDDSQGVYALPGLIKQDDESEQECARRAGEELAGVSISTANLKPYPTSVWSDRTTGMRHVSFFATVWSKIRRTTTASTDPVTIGQLRYNGSLVLEPVMQRMRQLMLPSQACSMDVAVHFLGGWHSVLQNKSAVEEMRESKNDNIERPVTTDLWCSENIKNDLIVRPIPQRRLPLKLSELDGEIQELNQDKRLYRIKNGFLQETDDAFSTADLQGVSASSEFRQIQPKRKLPHPVKAVEDAQCVNLKSNEGIHDDLTAYQQKPVRHAKKKRQQTKSSKAIRKASLSRYIDTESAEKGVPTVSEHSDHTEYSEEVLSEEEESEPRYSPENRIGRTTPRISRKRKKKSKMYRLNQVLEASDEEDEEGEQDEAVEVLLTEEVFNAEKIIKTRVVTSTKAAPYKEYLVVWEEGPPNTWETSKDDGGNLNPIFVEDEVLLAVRCVNVLVRAVGKLHFILTRFTTYVKHLSLVLIPEQQDAQKADLEMYTARKVWSAKMGTFGMW